MAFFSNRSLGLPLLVLLAMGNWGNTPSPPLDSNAPDPVGNEGELVLDGETYLIQSARLSGGSLSLLGERVGGNPRFSLSATFSGGDVDAESLRGASLGVDSGTVEVDGDQRAISGGSIKLSSASGSGPWEVDGEVVLNSSQGSLQGTLRARVQTS